MTEGALRETMLPLRAGIVRVWEATRPVKRRVRVVENFMMKESDVVAGAVGLGCCFTGRLKDLFVLL